MGMQITVQYGVSTIILDVESSDTVVGVKAKIQDQRGIALIKQQLTFNGTVLDNDQVLSYYNIQKNAELILTLILVSKQARQIAKLELAQTKRRAGGDTTKPYYRVRNTYKITQLPDTYNGNVPGADDNPNTSGLVLGRPWTAGSQNDFEFSSNDNRWLINNVFASGSTFSDPAPSNPTYTYPDGGTGKTYDFDGTTAMFSTDLEIPNAWQSTTITVDFWFYPTANTVQLLTELSQPAFNLAYHTTLLEISSTGNIKARFWQGHEGEQIITSTNTVDLNQWNHIYFIERADGTHAFELNGVATTGTPTYTRITPQANEGGVHFAVGGYDTTNMGGTGGLQGKIGNLNLHDYIVASTYNALKTRFGL